MFRQFCCQLNFCYDQAPTVILIFILIVQHAVARLILIVTLAMKYYYLWFYIITFNTFVSVPPRIFWLLREDATHSTAITSILYQEISVITPLPLGRSKRGLLSFLPLCIFQFCCHCYHLKEQANSLDYRGNDWNVKSDSKSKQNLYCEKGNSFSC